MKKTILLILFFLSVAITLCSAQSIHDQKVSSFINQGEWFELRDYYEQNEGQIGEFMKLCAGGLIGHYFNDPKKAIKNLELFTEKYGPQLGASNIDFICLLAENYANNKEYSKSVSIYESLIAQLQAHLPVEKINKFKSSRNRYTAYMDREGLFEYNQLDENLVIPFELIDGGVFFTVSCNKSKLKAIFDTGASMNIISENLANKTGIECLSDSILFNETTFAKVGFANFVSIGKLTLRNVPFVILPDDSPKSTAANKLPFDIVLGTEVMKVLKEAHFNFKKNEIIIPHLPESRSEVKKNMIYIDNTTYINLKLNDKPTLLFYDSGYNGELMIFPKAANVISDSINVDKLKKEKQNFLYANNPISVDVSKIDGVKIGINEEDTIKKNAYLGSLNIGSPYASGVIGKTLTELSNYMIVNFQDLYISFSQLPYK